MSHRRGIDVFGHVLYVQRAKIVQVSQGQKIADGRTIVMSAANQIPRLQIGSGYFQIHTSVSRFFRQGPVPRITCGNKSKPCGWPLRYPLRGEGCASQSREYTAY